MTKYKVTRAAGYQQPEAVFYVESDYMYADSNGSVTFYNYADRSKATGYFSSVKSVELADSELISIPREKN